MQRLTFREQIRAFNWWIAVPSRSAAPVAAKLDPERPTLLSTHGNSLSMKSIRPFYRRAPTCRAAALFQRLGERTISGAFDLGVRETIELFQYMSPVPKAAEPMRPGLRSRNHSHLSGFRRH
jgi:hypothetical protein